jgi:Tol biopolymer transport system component/predicted Ser/Thr protein kinase
MTLSNGTRLGPYELVAPVGAGGMGEIYRAKDTRLDRTVAVKVLPEHLSSSAESRQRFEREAKTISQLSHPHICALYDVGNQDGVEFLVMEYLEGETLSDRLLKGPLAFDQALRFGVEIADALDKAHRQGIVHRDLKPANVMITKSGVKLLDFGLAKAVAPMGRTSGSSLTALPTQAGSNLTQEGTILGTFQYMAPEQLEGKEADARTDIFAFGCVLYEMATGQKAFSGKSQASLISSIMGSQPPTISTISPMTPPAFDRVVRTCLAKDPDDRWQTAHDAMLELKWAGEGGSAAGLPAPVVARRRHRERLTWAALGLAAGGLAGGLASALLLSRSNPPPPVRFNVAIPRNTDLGYMALSPDGRQLAFVPEDVPGHGTIWLRSLDSVETRTLEGTKGARGVFWSPDGRSIAFFADGKLKWLPAAGGSLQTICDGNGTGGGAWSSDGTIVFSPDFGDALYRVPASGGTPVPVTKLDPGRQEVFHGWPHFLPDGKRFLYVARSISRDKTAIRAGSLESPDAPVVVLADSGGLYVPAGYLLFGREGALLAQKFHPGSVRVDGEATPLLPKIRIEFDDNHMLASASADGSVVAYVSGEPTPEQLTWLDRSGGAVGTVGAPADYGDLSLSPDGKNVLASIRDHQTGTTDIWAIDLARGTRTRLTADPADDFGALWSRDGERVLFTSDREGFYNLYAVAAGGGGATETVLKSGVDKWSTDWSADGELVLFNAFEPKTKFDIWALPVRRGGKPVELLRTAFSEMGARFSPDGRWIAYASDESGRSEVFVQSSPPSGFKRQVSTSGGLVPRFSRNGAELFYVSPDRNLMAADLRPAGAKLETGDPKALFELRRDGLEISPDGNRFLAVVPVDEASQPVTVVLNWKMEQKT